MKILLINKFLYPKGGDAISTLETGRMLSEKGHEVFFWGMKHPQNPGYLYQEYFVDNIDYLKKERFDEKIKVSSKILYSFEAKRKLEKLINIINPDIVHLNNFAHQISPSILLILKKYRIPSVMTMHDYKIVCASYLMLNRAKVCEACKGGRYYQCFLKSCVKHSRFKSLLNTTEMYLHHKILRIYDLVDVFISPSVFLKNKIEEMGLKRKIAYLPNFVNLKEYVPVYETKEKSFVYFGRLSYEKGLITLIRAVKGLDLRLKIIGEGPLMNILQSRIDDEGIKNIEFLGYKSNEELKEEILKSIFVVLPSEWYENNPRAIVESFALGKPVIGARIGGIPELVIDNKTGLTFESGNSEDLKKKILFFMRYVDKAIQMGQNARKFVEENFNQEKHYRELMQIYQKVMIKRNPG